MRAVTCHAATQTAANCIAQLTMCSAKSAQEHGTLLPSTPRSKFNTERLNEASSDAPTLLFAVLTHLNHSAQYMPCYEHFRPHSCMTFFVLNKLNVPGAVLPPPPPPNRRSDPMQGHHVKCPEWPAFAVKCFMLPPSGTSVVLWPVLPSPGVSVNYVIASTTSYIRTDILILLCSRPSLHCGKGYSFGYEHVTQIDKFDKYYFHL
jgi:hypothetical protein